jgi:hypothetical protein
MSSPADNSAVLAHTRRWLTDVVVGLNLCPFAKAVIAKGQVRIVVCEDADTAAVALTLADELTLLRNTPAEEIDTTLIVLPNCLTEFDRYLAFVEFANTIVRELRLSSLVQIATFHPDYQFADTEPDDIGNWTNRAPYPMLHLLREASVGRAVTTYPNPEDIYLRNIATLRALPPLRLAELFPHVK